MYAFQRAPTKLTKNIQKETQSLKGPNLQTPPPQSTTRTAKTKHLLPDK